MATIDPTKDIKPILKTDWTKKNINAPFYQQAEGDLPNRYSVSIETSFETTNGSDLELDNIKQSAVPDGFNNLIDFHEKEADQSQQSIAFAEDWFLSERPMSKIRILVSIPSDVLDGLPDKPEPEFLPIPWKEIYLNSVDLQKKIDGTVQLLKSYETEIKSFRGKVQGINLNTEVEDLNNSVVFISGLLESNNFSLDQTNSNLINLGIDEDYGFLYGQINDGSGFKNLYKGFNTFKNSPVSQNKRTVNFLLNLDEIYEIYFKNEELKFQEFLSQYVLNPPRYEFSFLPRNSNEEVANNPTKQAQAEDNNKPIKSSEELAKYVAATDTPEQREAAYKTLESTANFIGDTAVAEIQNINDYITYGTSFLNRNPGAYLADGIYKRLLNKIPLQDLIRGALECLGFPGFEFINLAQAYLSTANSFLRNIASLLQKQLPLIRIPDDFPIADYMADLGKQILNSVLEAVASALIQMLVELLQGLLEACKECALQNEAEGRGRFDGMNFGGGALERILEQSVVATASGIVQGVQRGTKSDVLADQALADARQSANNPLSITNRLNQSEFSEAFGGTTAEEYTKRLDAAKVEFKEYVTTAGQILTPGETGNLLLGCQTGTQAVDAITNLANRFPNIKWALAGDGVITPAQIKSLWEDMGKIVGDLPILETIQEITDSIPIEFQCLCDADDIKLRERLLKDKGLSDSQIKDQIDKSVARRNQRLKDLANALEKGNILDGMIPPVYCTRVYRDEEGNIVPDEKVFQIPSQPNKYYNRDTNLEVFPGVQKGMIERDHPAVTFLIDEVLETIYDAVEMTFNQDISGYVTALSKDTINEKTVPRVISAQRDDGTSELVINPEWTKLVKDPQLNYSWGALPSDASQPGTSLIDYENGQIESGNTVSEDSVLGGLASAYAAGQMQSGQQIPTAEQESTWEGINIVANTGGRKKPSEYDDSTNLGERQKRYSELYGYSPIPVTIKEKGPKTFAPGLKDTYKKICGDPELFNISDIPGAGYHLYNFKINNNVFEASGVSSDILNILSNTNIPKLPAPKGAVNFSDGSDLVSEALRNLFNSSYDMRYVVPYNPSKGAGSISQNYPTDTYGVTVAMTPTSQVAGSVSFPSFIIYQESESFDLSPEICNALTPVRGDFDEVDPHIPQEQFFTSLIQHSMKYGAPIYTPTDRSRRSTGFGDFSSDLKDFLYQDQFGYSKDQGTYDSLWRNFYCAFTDVISNSPLLDLKNIGSVSFIPTNLQGQDPNCDADPSVLDIANLKQRIKDEYSLIQCIDSVFPNTDGLGSNKDNPLEKANLGGAVLLTIRTYVLEVLLRSIHVFYYFKFKSPQSVDTLLISYIANILKKDVEEKGFMNEFRLETIELYNRNASYANAQPTEEFNTALNYFIRYQIFGICQRLTKTLGVVGDTSLDSYLMLGNTDQAAWLPEYNVPATRNDLNRILENGVQPSNNNRPLPVPEDKYLELVGNGTLTRGQLDKLNMSTSGTNLVSLFESLPIGFLFREYLKVDDAKKSEIWSTEPAQYSEIETNVLLEKDDFAPITGNEPLSRSKKGDNREDWLMINAGIRDENANYQFIDAYLNPSTDDPLQQQPSESDANYRYGISYPEQVAMSKLISILDISLSKIDLNNNVFQYVFYPGKILKERTKTLSSRQLWTFKPDQVWDNKAWNNTGRVSMPSWILDQYGTILQNNIGEEYSVPTIDQNVPKNPIQTSALRPTTYQRFPPYNHVKFKDGDQNPDSISKLRWINIDNKLIGPWQGSDLGSDFIGWKLIDYRYEYNLGGQKSAGTNTASTTANKSREFFEPSIENLIQGITVGGGDILDANYFSSGRNFQNQYFRKLQLRAAYLLLSGKIDYISLIDFDIFSIKRILQWEKSIIEGAISSNIDPFTHPNSPGAVQQLAYTADQKTEIIEAYDNWIQTVDEIIQEFSKAKKAREAIQQKLFSDISEYGIGTQALPSDINPGLGFVNGSLIKEIYLRVDEQDWQGIPYEDVVIKATWLDPGSIRYGYKEILKRQFPPNSELDFRRPIEEAKWSNSNYVDKGSRTEFLKQVVNINKFQQYLDERFVNGEPDPSILAGLPSDCHPQKLSRALIQDLTFFEACGEAQAAELGITLPPDRNDFLLLDFFKSVKLGMRISYVVPFEDPQLTSPAQSSSSGGGGGGGSRFQNPNTSGPPPYTGDICTRNHEKDTDLKEYLSSRRTSVYDYNIFKDIEDEVSGVPFLNSMYEKAYYVPNVNNQIHVIPLVCQEIEIDPLTKMSDVNKKYNFQGTQIGFFENEFKKNYNNLINGLSETDEYKALFKYMLPIDRMLSLNHIYGSEYIRTYKDIPELFDPTKTRLKDLFFILYNSGNYNPSGDCLPSNKDLFNNMMNGIPWAGIAATLAIMIAKTALLIFKGFVEAFDINIIVSKTIRDSIRIINNLIAQAQVLANTTQQLGAQAANLFDFDTSGGACAKGSPSAGNPPPDSWFDPVNETFVPEPQIMFISLALLPITLLPLLWPGLPITPFGLAYWFLDAKPYDVVPGPNWLNAMPPAEFLDQLFSRNNADIQEALNPGLNSECEIDYGLPEPKSEE